MYNLRTRAWMRQISLAAVALLVLGFGVLDSLASLGATEDEEPWQSPVPVIFEGTRYEAQAFNELLTTDLSGQELILLPAENREMEPFLYAFRTVDDAMEFIMETREVPDHAPFDSTPIERQSKKGGLADKFPRFAKPSMYHSTFTFFDFTNFGGSSLTTYYDLANLGTVGSGWNNRISSVQNGGQSILYDGTNYSGTGLTLWYWTDYEDLGIYGFDNRGSLLDYYPFQ